MFPDAPAAAPAPPPIPPPAPPDAAAPDLPPADLAGLPPDLAMAAKMCGGDQFKLDTGKELMVRAEVPGLNEKDILAAAKTYTPSGKRDEFVVFSSGGQSGQVIVYGVPATTDGRFSPRWILCSITLKSSVLPEVVVTSPGVVSSRM